MTSPKNTLGYTQAEYKKFSRYGMLYLVMFSVFYMTLYCCRLNLPNASAVMIRELGFSKADIGILTSTLFWTYGIGQLINGRLSEALGPGRFVALAAVLSAAANFLFGFQTSLVLMAVIWAVNGFFQSMAWTPGIAALTKWFPGRRRGFAMGFADAFSGFGQGFAALAVALALNISQGWRIAFVIPPLFPLVFLVLFRIIARESPKAIGLEDYKEENPGTAAQEAAMQQLIRERGALYPFRHVLANPTFRAWLVIAFLIGLVRYGLTIWIPLYFVDRFGIDVTAGLLQSLALPVGMGIGAIAVPSLTDKLCPRDRLPAVMISAIGAALVIAPFFMLNPTNPTQLVLAQVLLFLAGFFIYAICGTVWAYATDLGGRVFGGTCSGVLNFGCYMGAGVQSVFYGFLTERLGWGILFGSVAACCACIALLAFCGRSEKQQP